MKLTDIKPHLLTINLFPCEKNFCTNERFLPNPYFLYVHKGRGAFVINGQKYMGSRGDLFYCGKGVGNTILADGEDPFLLSGIDFFFAKTDGGFDDFQGFKPKINLTSHDFSLQLIKEMIRTDKNRTAYAREFADSILKVFILLAAQITVKEPVSSRTNVQDLLGFIENNITRELTAEEIAREYHYYPGSMNRIVKSNTGLSLRQYQIHLRIKKAMDLLEYSNKSMKEIACLCGYNSIFYFSRQFRQKTGVSPSSYKKSPTRP